MENVTLDELQLHQEITIKRTGSSRCVKCMRVVGGWVYTGRECEAIAMAFVPDPPKTA